MAPYGVVVTVLLLSALRALCHIDQDELQLLIDDEDYVVNRDINANERQFSGEGSEAAFAMAVELPLVLQRTWDAGTLRALLENIMEDAGYNTRFFFDTTGYLPRNVTVYAITRDLDESKAVEKLLYYSGLVDHKLTQLGVSIVKTIEKPISSTTEMPTQPASLLRVILHPNKINLVEGDTIRITSLSLSREVLFTWSRRDGKPLPANSRVENYNVSSVLVITGVMPGDAGKYQLIATGSSGQVLILTVDLKVTALNAECEFQCGDNTCIARKRVCDGYNDCANGIDESGCYARPHGRCFPKEFSCAGRCIDFGRVCDGLLDCKDKSDEALCVSSAKTCQSDEFYCSRNKCVKRDWLCDGDYDCEGGSDEHNCDYSLSGSLCPSTHFACLNHQCIPKAKVCDGRMHCLDGSDEQNCSEPVFSVSLPVSSIVNIGDTLSLVCETTGDPAPVVTFLRDGKKLPFDSRIRVTSQAGVGRVSVRNFSSKDAGIYTCEVKNIRGRRRSIAIIDVKDSVVEECNDPDLTQSVPKGAEYHKVVHDSSRQACVDLIFIVDESGSMTGEHKWLKATVPKLERRLVDMNIGTGALKNRYGLVGFGHEVRFSYAVMHLDLGSAAVIPVGSDPSFMGSDKELVAALDKLHTDGSLNDIYAAMGIALDTFKFRSSCALHFILVTDASEVIRTTDYSYMLASLHNARVTLHVVADQKIFQHGTRLLGMNAKGNGFIQVRKTYTTIAGASFGNGNGTTYEDYVRMAFATEGATWDLNMLREGGITATAFTEAFININVEELQRCARCVKVQNQLLRCVVCICVESEKVNCRLTNILPIECPAHVPTVIPNSTNVSVPSRVNIVVDPNVATKDEGHTIVFTCRVVISPRFTFPVQLQLHWFYRGRQVRPGNDVIVASNSSTLMIKNIRESHGGDYECRGSNSDEFLSDSGTLIVHVAPSCRIEPRVAEVSDGGTVTFRCITSGFPKPLVKWTRADGGLLPRGLGTGAAYFGNTLEFDLTSDDDAGEYVCTAVNSAGQARDTSRCRRLLVASTIVASTPAAATLPATTEFTEPLLCNISGKTVFVENKTMIITREKDVNRTDGYQQTAADVVLLVDESRSMYGERNWLETMVWELNDVLKRENIGVDDDFPNMYGVLGFAANFRRDYTPGRVIVSSRNESMFPVEDVESALRKLSVSGKKEDGYSAIDTAIREYGPLFRDPSRVARQFILITDEDRDVLPGKENLTFNQTLNKLKPPRTSDNETYSDIVLNVLVKEAYETSSGKEAFGMDSDLRCYVARPRNPSRNRMRYDVYQNCRAVPDTAHGTTHQDYTDLAIATKGSAWSLDMLNDNDIIIARSFMLAYVHVKVSEIVTQLYGRCQLCECQPGSLVTCQRIGSSNFWYRRTCSTAQAVTTMQCINLFLAVVIVFLF